MPTEANVKVCEHEAPEQLIRAAGFMSSARELIGSSVTTVFTFTASRDESRRAFVVATKHRWERYLAIGNLEADIFNLQRPFVIVSLGRELARQIGDRIECRRLTLYTYKAKWVALHYAKADIDGEEAKYVSWKKPPKKPTTDDEPHLDDAAGDEPAYDLEGALEEMLDGLGIGREEEDHEDPAEEEICENGEGRVGHIDDDGFHCDVDAVVAEDSHIDPEVLAAVAGVAAAGKEAVQEAQSRAAHLSTTPLGDGMISLVIGNISKLLS